ncbi:MAG: hypothetical protein QXT00_02355 [Ignisphaera sp.]
MGAGWATRPHSRAGGALQTLRHGIQRRGCSGVGSARRYAVSPRTDNYNPLASICKYHPRNRTRAAERAQPAAHARCAHQARTLGAQPLHPPPALPTISIRLK